MVTQPTPEQFQAIISALRQQRDAANDQIVQLAAQLALMTNELTETKDRLKNVTTPHPVDGARDGV